METCGAAAQYESRLSLQLAHVAAELKAAQAVCQPDHLLADIATVEIAVGEPNSLFTPIKPIPSEEPAPAPPPVAAAPAAKAPAKGAAAKGPAGAAAKGPAPKGAAAAAAAAADQAPPVGAPETGRALELLGSQVHQYYAWREAAKVMGLPAEPISQDDLAGFRALLQDAPQVCSRQAFVSAMPALRHWASFGVCSSPEALVSYTAVMKHSAAGCARLCQLAHV